LACLGTEKDSVSTRSPIHDHPDSAKSRSGNTPRGGGARSPPAPEVGSGRFAAGESLNNPALSEPLARSDSGHMHPPRPCLAGEGRGYHRPWRWTDDANHTRSGRLSSAISVADSCQLRNSWARAPTKVVPSCDKRWVGARNLRSTDHRIGTPIPQGIFRKEREPPEVKHSSRGRTRNQPRCRE
jgi:hypothetical protein